MLSLGIQKAMELEGGPKRKKKKRKYSSTNYHPFK